MADIDILSMPPAPGLGGGEYIPIVQGGVNKRTTAAAIADLAIVPSAVVWKDQVQYATTVALPTNIYDNGTGGVGATLTAVSNGPLQIDGSFQSIGDRVLIKNETPQANNGIYSVISAGSGSLPWQLERTPDFNQVSLIAPGDAVTVALGTSLAQTFWIETVFVTSVGSSPIIFSELFTPLTAGNGIEIDNFVVSIDPTVVATLTDHQTLTNKTLVDPAITGYTASEAVATDASGAVVTIPNTGTGNNVLAISPVLTTPNLGIPSAIDLTNATNLPIGTLPKGTNDYPLVGNGGLAPSYRQVPIATGVAGLAAGIATFLGTPSSANLATAVTDETGIGSLVFSGSPALTGNPTAPTQTVGDNSTKIATTAYVQAAVSGTTTLPATKYGTIAALPTVTYANGSSGVGATLTATANGALSVDSSSPSVADAILVKNQASTFQNGIYAVTATGDGSNPFVLTRETYYDQSTDIDLGDTTFVTSGTTLAATSWTQNGTENPVVGTNPITFAQTGGPGSFVAGNGISISGTSIAINTAVTVDKTTAQTLSSKTFVSPVINGASTGTGVATVATPSTLMQRGANGNAQANVFIPSYTSTPTAAGTTTLTVASTQLQKFTGTTTQTVVLPDVSTLAIGHTFEFNNQSTGAVTVESSGGDVLVVLAPGAYATVNSNSQAGTTAASWDLSQYGIGSTGILPSANGGTVQVSNTAALQAVDHTKNSFAEVVGSGGQNGPFVFMEGDYSAEVTADPQKGIYAAPLSDTSGASGAWVRLCGNTYYAGWFGAQGDTRQASCAVTIADSSTALTATGANFTNADVGKTISIGDGPTGDFILGTTITDVADASHCTLAAGAPSALTASTQTVTIGTDDTATLQAALNISSLHVLNLNGLTYTTTTCLEVPSNVTIDGAQATVIPSAVFNYTTIGPDGAIFRNENYLTSTELQDHDIKVKDVTFDWRVRDALASTGQDVSIFMRYVDRIDVDQCIQYWGANVTGLQGCSDTAVRFNRAYECGNCPYDHWNSDKNAIVIGNFAQSLTRNPAQGIQFTADNANPDGSSGSGGAGLRVTIANNQLVFSGSPVTTRSGIIVNCISAGTTINTATIVGNQVDGLDFGIVAQGAITNLVVNDNIVNGSATQGILILHGDTTAEYPQDGTIANNVVTNPGLIGIDIQYASGLAVNGNRVVGTSVSGSVGINFRVNSANCSANGNLISGFATPLENDGTGNFIDFNSGSWTPTISSSSGSGLTTTLTEANWYQNGHIVTCFYNFTITANGTASGFISMNLPVAAKNGYVSGPGFNIASPQFGISATYDGTTAVALQKTTDGSYIGATGNQFIGSFIYEAS